MIGSRFCLEMIGRITFCCLGGFGVVVCRCVEQKTTRSARQMACFNVCGFLFRHVFTLQFFSFDGTRSLCIRSQIDEPNSKTTFKSLCIGIGSQEISFSY